MLRNAGTRKSSLRVPDTTLKVVFCQPTLNRTGSENSLLQMLVALQSMSTGWKFTLVAGQDGLMRTQFEDVCDEVRIVSAPKLKRGASNIVQFILSFFRVYRALRLLRAGNVVVYVNSLMFPQAAVAGLLASVPVIVHVREVASTYPRGVYRLYMFVAALSAKKVVAACNFVFRQRQVPSLLVRPRKREVIYNAAKGGGEFISRNVRSPFKVLAVIPCTVRKGILDLIDFARHMKESLTLGQDFCIDVVGKIDDGDTYEHALRKLEDNGTLNNVRFHGEVECMSRFYKEAHILLHPSHSECFPRVLVEACGFSLPCVATDVGGTSEIIVSGVNGELVPVRRSKEMAERTLEILLNSERYAKYADNAFRKFQTSFELDQLGQSCARVIRQTQAI